MQRIWRDIFSPARLFINFSHLLSDNAHHIKRYFLSSLFALNINLSHLLSDNAHNMKRYFLSSHFALNINLSYLLSDNAQDMKRYLLSSHFTLNIHLSYLLSNNAHNMKRYFLSSHFALNINLLHSWLIPTQVSSYFYWCLIGTIIRCMYFSIYTFFLFMFWNKQTITLVAYFIIPWNLSFQYFFLFAFIIQDFISTKSSSCLLLYIKFQNLKLFSEE